MVYEYCRTTPNVVPRIALCVLDAATAGVHSRLESDYVIAGPCPESFYLRRIVPS